MKLEMPKCKLTNKAHSHVLLHVFCLKFFRIYHIMSSEEALKMSQHNFFPEIKRKVMLLVIYLFNYDSSKSTLFTWHFTFSGVQFLSNKWEFFVPCNTQRLQEHPSFFLCFEMYFSIKTLLFSIMLNEIFYSVLTSVSNSHFLQ